MTLNRIQQPALNKVRDIQIPGIQRQKLENGLALSMINIGTQELVKLQISIPAGIIYQDKSLLAFFTNKMLKEGSQHYSASEIAQKMDYYGAYFETRISRDFAYFNLFCLNKYLNEVLPLVVDMLVHPAFSKEEFLVVRDQEKQSFQIRMQKVKSQALREFNFRLFGQNHPYGSYAENSDYDRIQIEELREFHANYYHMQNWQLYLSGKIDDEVIELIQKYFGSIPCQYSDLLPKTPSIMIPKAPAKLYHSLKEGASQTALKIGNVSIDRLHEDYPALSLAQTVLGGYFGSRLMQNIREDKGFTYGIYASIQHLNQASVFSIGSEVGSTVAKTALEEVRKELRLLRTEVVGDEELGLVKNYMSGSLLRSLNGPFSLSEMMRMLHEFRLPEDYYAQYTLKVQNTAALQLLEVAEKYLHEDSMTSVIVGTAF